MRWHEKGIVKKMKMQIKKIEGDFTVCKVVDFSEVNFEAEYCFTAKTDEEEFCCLPNGRCTEEYNRTGGRMESFSGRRDIGFFIDRYISKHFSIAGGSKHSNIYCVYI